MKRNRNFLKRTCTAALALAMCACVVLGTTSTAHATGDIWDTSTHEVRGSYLYLDNYHDYECDATLYVLTENNPNYTTFKYPYQFECRSNFDPTWGSGIPMALETFVPNGTEVEVLDCGTVYSYSFSIKDADYAFSCPDGGYGVMALTRDFSSPFIGHGFYTFEDGRDFNYEITTVAEGEHVRIYAMLGEYQWATENVGAFADWAKEYDSNFSVDTGAGGEPPEVSEVASEPTLSFAEDKSEVQDEAPSASEPESEEEEYEGGADDGPKVTEVRLGPGAYACAGLSVLLVAVAVAVVVLVLRKKRG